jgi:ABC-type glutathione transport system ATPase component
MQVGHDHLLLEGFKQNDGVSLVGEAGGFRLDVAQFPKSQRTGRAISHADPLAGRIQQVAIGRALMSRPKLLLMDEPSAGLSPLVVGLMIDTIRTLHASA